MKNNFSLILLTSLLLSGCNSSSNKTNSPLIFSEIHIGTSPYNWSVELANVSNKDIDLSSYNIDIYQGSSNNKISIKLEGVIEPQGTFVISNDKAEETILKKSNMLSDLLEIDGTYPLALTKSNKKMDVLGVIGYRYDYASTKSLVRKLDYMYGRLKFQEYDWLRYEENNTNFLSNLDNSITEEELLEGPRLTAEDFARPFAINSSVGGGGAVKVNLAYTGDGDTTNFYFPEEYSEFNIKSRESVRYMVINTPETQHGTSINADPWGNAARDYNNMILNQSKSFAVQTSKGYTLRETFGRIMAYVWVSDKVDPSPEDYRMLNFMMVKEGYSTLRFISGYENNDPMLYKQMRYTSIIRNAEILAEQQGLKVHGQIDPDFDY